MLKKTLDKIWPARQRKLVDRNFQPQMLLNREHHDQLAAQGYVHIPSVLTQEEVRTVTNFFSKVREQNNFQDTDYYINTICFEDAGLRKHIQTTALEHVKKAIGRIVDLKKATFPLGAGICINPANSTSGSRPHQDPTQVDESTSYSMTIWIALTDCTVENGCIHLIPGSHLWGNTRRAGSIHWAFDDLVDELWEMSVPMPVAAGDILCFDVSTIHSSTANQTGDHRLALSITTIPGDLQMVNYFPKGKSILRPTAELFHVDGEYFLNEEYFTRPSGKYPLIRTEPLDNRFTTSNIRELNSEFKRSYAHSTIS